MTPLPRIVPRVVSRNWRLKLAAIGLAVFLWALVRSEPTTGVNIFTVPVQAQVGDLDWALAAQPDPATVQVRLRGPTEDLIRVARQGTTLRVPLDSVSSPDTVVQLRRDWVVLSDPSALVVEDITPGTVRLALQPTLTRALPLRMSTRGSLDEALAFGAPVVLDPPTVRVRGPAHRLRDLDSVGLEPLDLGEVRESGSYRVAVDTSGLGDMTVSPLSATISVRVEPVVGRVLSAVPVVIEDSTLLAEPALVEVRLTGARTPVTGTREEEVEAVVALEGLAELSPGESRMAPIALRGLPPLVRAFADVDSVLVRRAEP